MLHCFPSRSVEFGNWQDALEIGINERNSDDPRDPWRGVRLRLIIISKVVTLILISEIHFGPTTLVANLSRIDKEVMFLSLFPSMLTGRPLPLTLQHIKSGEVSLMVAWCQLTSWGLTSVSRSIIHDEDERIRGGFLLPASSRAVDKRGFSVGCESRGFILLSGWGVKSTRWDLPCADRTVYFYSVRRNALNERGRCFFAE